MLSERARRWAQAVAPSEILRVRPIGGGITATKWVLHLTGGDPLVIRWSDPQVWGASGREHVRREALACRLLAASELPVPELVASDLDGTVAGGPANVMTWRPGQVRLDRLEPAAVSALARLTVAVHRQRVLEQQRPPTFSSRGPARPEVPSWARRPGLWRQILGFLPDPAHILVAVASSRPELSAAAIRHRLKDLLAVTLS